VLKEIKSYLEGNGYDDAPLHSLKDSNVNPKVETMEGVGVCSHFITF
jgi:hypothetical protein